MSFKSVPFSLKNFSILATLFFVGVNYAQKKQPDSFGMKLNSTGQ